MLVYNLENRIFGGGVTTSQYGLDRKYSKRGTSTFSPNTNLEKKMVCPTSRNNSFSIRGIKEWVALSGMVVFNSFSNTQEPWQQFAGMSF